MSVKESLKANFELKMNDLPMDIGMQCKDKNMDEHSPYGLFCHFFECIPQIETIHNMDCNQVLRFLREKYNYNTITQFYNRYSSKYYDDFKNEYFNFIFYDEFLVHLDFLADKVQIFYRVERLSRVKNIWNELSEFSNWRKVSEPKISIILNDGGNLITRRMAVKPSNVDLDLHYNADFIRIHKVILESLNRNNEHGLVLLHGLPGTGKTNYLRYLLTEIQKDVIFFPVHLAMNMTHSEILALLMKNRNSVFVIEDAENLVIDRNNGTSAVGDLLNISDGLLSDSLAIQFVCTFNTNLKNIDKALLRKGRLIAKYEFTALEKGKAQKLSDSLGYQTVIKKDTVLAEVFHQDVDNGATASEESLGFAIGS